MGQRHLRGARFSNEQGSELTTSSATGADAKSALSTSRWVKTCGRRTETPLRARGAAGPLPRDKPSRLSLPITALRETPISFAICEQAKPGRGQGEVELTLERAFGANAGSQAGRANRCR